MITEVKNILQGPLRALCVLVLVAVAMPLGAQQLGVPQTDVLTISSERLFADSAFGQRVFREIEAESTLLAEENERIVAQLSKEEKYLTEKRSDLSADEFRPLAEAFDEKVQSHRDGQRAKLDALARRGEEARGQFFEMAQPVLIELLREFGASIVIERSNVVLSTDASDITNAAIARIDAAIGDGATLENNNNE
ncbi:OmpH family outer membrane protein [Ruegeria sp. SCSIO 43209]|uniref:OmpH family outer membrane protein n=1 Tax=Ruegeria sp. SCSIO 43209 TaxID=2793010 RepID=UPI001CA851DC|nr:OmpH family outer membrane protein [Ruegeria sp. SCSIO 43209]UAB90444.1 OmpH family outer membrane protein [Ruegeria sp. SCSIO 43209]